MISNGLAAVAFPLIVKNLPATTRLTRHYYIYFAPLHGCVDSFTVHGIPINRVFAAKADSLNQRLARG